MMKTILACCKSVMHKMCNHSPKRRNVINIKFCLILLTFILCVFFFTLAQCVFVFFLYSALLWTSKRRSEFSYTLFHFVFPFHSILIKSDNIIAGIERWFIQKLNPTRISVQHILPGFNMTSDVGGAVGTAVAPSWDVIVIILWGLSVKTEWNKFLRYFLNLHKPS